MKRHLTLLFSALAAIATARGVPHNMVSRHTPVNTNLIGAVVGEGLSLSNGVLSSTRGEGGDLDGQAVTNIVEGIVVNKALMVDESGAVTNYTDVTINNLGVGQFFRAGGSMVFYHPGGGEILPEDEVARQGDLVPYAKTADLGSAAFKDATEFATAADEALVYQLITNRMSGVTFDFATVAGLYLAISNIVAAQGGAITNFPAIP